MAGLKILIVGSGGREHALYRACTRSSRTSRVFVGPGNAGIPDCDRVALREDDPAAVYAFSAGHGIDLVVIGPEAPLVGGLSDFLRERAIRVFGPSRTAAELEGSKAFVAQLCAERRIPAPRSHVATSFDEAARIINKTGYLVVKADGICAGKGVIVGDSVDEAVEAARSMLIAGAFGQAGAQIVIQERVSGLEASLLYFCDGWNLYPLPAAQDAKRAFDGDQGPNTGGMGAFAPHPSITRVIEAQIASWIARPAITHMRLKGTPFCGLFYVGVMLTPVGPKLIEFNARFGDPETQAVLPLVEDDIVRYLWACSMTNGLNGLPRVTPKPGATVCTVLASHGYPGPYQRDVPIHNADTDSELAWLIHAGTRKRHDGQLMTSRGRVLAACGYGHTIAEAREHSLTLARKVAFHGKHHRSDIAAHV